MKTRIASAATKLIPGIVLLAGWLMPPSTVEAQQKPEPSAIIAVAPIDDLLKDAQYMAGAVGEMYGQMSGMARMQAEGFLVGVDFTKPAGALLYFQDGKQEPDSVGFFPVKNMDDLLDKISEFAEVEEDGDMVTITPDNGQEMTMTLKGDYAFFSDQSDMLKDLPADPASMVSAQTSQYSISAQVFPQRIPEDLRQQAIDMIAEGFEDSMQDMDDLQAELQQANFENQMKQFELLINESEKLLVGFKADKASERLLFDFNLKCIPGSEFEAKMKSAKSADKTQFAGFLMDDAAFTMHSCSGISKEDAEQQVDSLKKMLETVMADRAEDMEASEVELMKKVSDTLLDSVRKTLLAGTLDMGGVGFTGDGLNAAFGGRIVDARGLESSIKEIVSQAKSEIEGAQVTFNLNSGSHGGYNLHEIMITPDSDDLDESFNKIFGDQVQIILGIGDDKVYVGVGKEPAATLKKSIDANASGSTASMAEGMGQFNMFVAPIMNLVSQVADEPMVEKMRAKMNEVGKDRVRIAYDVVDGEMRMRTEIQDGILQLIGVVAESFGGGMGGGGADF